MKIYPFIASHDLTNNRLAETTANKRANEQAAARERIAGRRFDVELCEWNGLQMRPVGGQWLGITHQQAKQTLVSMGLEKVQRTADTKYVLVLNEYNADGKRIGFYECRVGSFPSVRLTDWVGELKKLHTRAVPKQWPD